MMMQRTRWQEHIPSYKLTLFQAYYNSFLQNPITRNSLFLHPEYESYLDMPLSSAARRNLYKDKGILHARIAIEKRRLKHERIHGDFLLKLLPKWVHEGFHRNMFPGGSKGRIFLGRTRSLFELDSPYAFALTLSFQNILCLTTWEFTVTDLAKLAVMGDDRSAFRLVRLNALFVTAKWMRDRISLAQYHNDSRFLTRVGDAMKKPLIAQGYQKARIGAAILLLWFLGFKDLPRMQLHAFLSEKGIITNSMSQEYLNIIVSRLGLRR
jgi:hypothetical protein